MAQIHNGQTKMQVPKEEFDNNWEKTFGKKKAKYNCDWCKDTEMSEGQPCYCVLGKELVKENV